MRISDRQARAALDAWYKGTAWPSFYADKGSRVIEEMKASIAKALDIGEPDDEVSGTLRCVQEAIDRRQSRREGPLRQERLEEARQVAQQVEIDLLIAKQSLASLRVLTGLYQEVIAVLLALAKHRLSDAEITDAAVSCGIDNADERVVKMIRVMLSLLARNKNEGSQ